ncbi:MAG: hypothetical protein M3076_04690 [Actinomycetota bacterium]|nr:hypothetical protein [Actinomycetota bacterium]
MGFTDIDAYVTEATTRVDAVLRFCDLPVKSHERAFFERVPLPGDARSEIAVSDPWDYAVLAEGVEAWGFAPCPRMASCSIADRPHHSGLSGSTDRWWQRCVRPTVIGDLMDTEAYMRVVTERYRLLRTHAWNDELLQRVVQSSRPAAGYSAARSNP